MEDVAHRTLLEVQQRSFTRSVFLLLLLGMTALPVSGAEPGVPGAPNISTRAAILDAEVEELMTTGNLIAAEQAARQALALRRQALGEADLEVARTLGTLGWVLRAQERWDEALEAYERGRLLFESAQAADLRLAPILGGLGLIRTQRGEHAEAIALQRRSLALREAGLDANHPDLVASLTNLGKALAAAGQPQEARPVLQRALSIQERTLGSSHSDLVELLDALADGYREEENFPAARALYERVLAIEEEALGPDHESLAITLSDLAGVRMRQGAPQAAKLLLERALQISESHVGPNDASLRDTLVRLGAAYSELGEHMAALTSDERALRLAMAELGEDAPELAGLWSNVGVDQNHVYRWTDARHSFERALALREKAVGPNHPDVARELLRLGGPLEKLDDMPAAQRAYERALRIQLKQPAPDPDAVLRSTLLVAGSVQAQGNTRSARALWEPALAQAAGSPAVLARTGDAFESFAFRLWRSGEYVAARSVLERVLVAKEQEFGPGDPRLVWTLVQMARVLNSQRDVRAARQLLERALQLEGPDAEHGSRPAAANLVSLLLAEGDLEPARVLIERDLRRLEARVGPDALETGEALTDLVKLQRLSGRLDQALSTQRRVLAILERWLGSRHVTVAMELRNLAALLSASGDHAGARTTLERAVELAEAASGPNLPDLRYLYRPLSRAQWELGEHPGAVRTLERALLLEERVNGPYHPNVAEDLNNLALKIHAQGQPLNGRALESAIRAAQINDRAADHLLPTLSPAEQSAWISGAIADSRSVLLSLWVSSGQAEVPYPVFAGWKGLLLQGLVRQGAVATLAQDSRHGAAVTQLMEIRAQVAHAFRTGSAGLDALTKRKEALERQLSAALPDGVADDPWRQGGIDALQPLLPTDGVLVDVYRYVRFHSGRDGEARYAAVVVPPRGPPSLVDLGAAAHLDLLVARWRDAVTRGGSAHEVQDALLRAVWMPVALALPKSTRRVWISPDDQLARLPWGALVQAHAPTSELLIADVTSPRALLLHLSRAPGSRVTGRKRDERPAMAVLVGGVEFGTGAPWQGLAGTAAEVSAIAQIAAQRGIATRTLAGMVPTPREVSIALPQARWAHLATHGFFFREQEAAYASRGAMLTRPEGKGLDSPGRPLAASRTPLAESGLALAGANNGPEGNLTAEQIVGLQLSGVELMVLSACDTGRGTEITGQGVMGLRASLEAAGVQTLLMSLWKVPDESTAVLMQHFYRELWEESRAPAEALRMAQAAVRANPRFAAPVHWAGWVLTGRAW